MFTDEEIAEEIADKTGPIPDATYIEKECIGEGCYRKRRLPSDQERGRD